jgi:hypothetical protein
LRFVIAIVLFVVALVTIGLGIAQRTILQGPDSHEEVVATGDAPITVVDGDALNALPGTQTIDIEGSDDIFLAYGRTNDVLAWVGDLPYTHVTYTLGDETLSTENVPGSSTPADGETPAPGPSTTPPAQPTPGATDQPGIEPFSGEVPDPHGSDLWVQEFDGNRELVRKINAPEDVSLIIMSNGVDPAPGAVALRWPLDNSAPLSGPLIITGIGSLLAGLLAFLWGLVHARRRRGPRRKQPRLPRAPQPKRLKRAPQRKEITTGRRSMVAAAGVLAGALALTGCSTGPTLGSGLAASPEPGESDAPAEVENLKPPAVTEQQLGRIIHNLAATVSEADEGKDAKIAATRLAGPALAARLANYKITAKDSSLAAIAPFPDGKVDLVLPQQNEGWPRSVFAVVSSADATTAPAAVLLIQESPRDNYQAHYLITLEPGLVVPPVAPASIGAAALDAENQFGVLAPSQLAASYGEVLIKGEEAADFDKFEPEGDTLRADIGFEAKQKRKKDLPKQAKIEFTNGAGAEPPISFPTNDSGQIVAVSLDDVETVTPVEAGAAINTKGAVKALSGLARSTKGIVATYGVQLLFYVPPIGGSSADKIQLLGFSQGLISAEEVD